MSADQQPLCFQCGHETGEPVVPELPDGSPCPACRDRLLESLPAPFPSAPAVAVDEVEAYRDDDGPHRA